MTCSFYPDGSTRLLREAIGEVHGLDPDRIVAGGEGSGPLLTLLAMPTCSRATRRC